MPEPQQQTDTQKLKQTALELRKSVIGAIAAAGSGNVGGCLSATEIVTALFFSELRYNPADPSWPDRDRFVLSKSHACPLVYAAMVRAGFCKDLDLTTLRKLDSPFQGHPSRARLPGIEVSSSTPAAALSVASGMAIATRLARSASRTYVLLGEGELQQGALWEAAMTAGHYRLSNLCAIVDCNGLQQDGPVHEIKQTGPFEDRWRSLGWECLIVNGHNPEDVLRAFTVAKRLQQKPSCIIARTVKGKGVPFMENKPVFHAKPLTPDERDRAIASVETVHC